jgi:hypothetical protein
LVFWVSEASGTDGVAVASGVAVALGVGEASGVSLAAAVGGMDEAARVPAAERTAAVDVCPAATVPATEVEAALGSAASGPKLQARTESVRKAVKATAGLR